MLTPYRQIAAEVVDARERLTEWAVMLGDDRAPGWALAGHRLVQVAQILDEVCVIGDMAIRLTPDRAQAERVGDWVVTRTGAKYWPLDPRAAEVHTADLAWSLSMKPRFNGHTKLAMPISAHSLLVAVIADRLRSRDYNLRHLVPEIVLAYAILHDGNEAYLPDVPRPLKRFIPGWARIENANQKVIHRRYGLDPVPPDEVMYLIKQADDFALAIEARALCTETPDETFDIYGPLPDDEIQGLAEQFLPTGAGDKTLEEWVSIFVENLNAVVPAEHFVPDEAAEPPQPVVLAPPTAPSATASWRTEVPTVAETTNDEARARAEERLRAEGSL